MLKCLVHLSTLGEAGRGVVETAACLGTPAGKNRVRESYVLTTYWSIILLIRWTELAPWQFEFPFAGSLTFTFPGAVFPYEGRSVALRLLCCTS